jgi:hypothetical protein
VSSAAAALAETIRRSGVRRVAFLGLAKNVGKTTALVATLAEMDRLGVAAGTTSAGRDGEEFDAITGEAKPRFRVRAGQLVASASATFAAASFPADLVSTLPFETRFGPVEIRRARSTGDIECIGPSTVTQMRATAGAMEEAGAELLLIDGALGRRAFAAARVADGIVLAVGLAAASSLEAVRLAARDAVELIRLPVPARGAPAREHAGALTDSSMRDRAPRRGETIVVDDFASVFLSPPERRRLREIGGGLAVRHPARLVAAVVNPTGPGRPPVPAREFFESLRRDLPGIPLFDLVANLRWEPA